MKIEIKPYELKYRDGVVNVLQYLWNFPLNERYSRFDWLYDSNSNPSFPETLAVVAVNEEDEILGFRGWVPGIIWQNGVKFVVARAADVVVSPKGRRQGIFSKMTSYSIKYLKEKGITEILNLSSNSQSNPGYVKLGWKPLVQLNIWYKINLKFGRNVVLANKKEYSVNDLKIVVLPFIPKGLRIPSDGDSLHFSMAEGQLDWYSNRPNVNYLTAVAYNANHEIMALFIIQEHNKKSVLSYIYYVNEKAAHYTFRLLNKHVRTRFVSVWGWAIAKDKANLLHKMGFIKIPFYEKFRKIPPILVRTTGKIDEDKNWFIGEKDIRVVANWDISRIDNF